MKMDYISNLLGKITCKRQIILKIFMFGLDGAGKTTVMYKLKMCEPVEHPPTHGFNVETIEYKNVILTIWDMGRRTLMMSVKELWKRYFVNVNHPVHGFIFVLDSSNIDRMEEARQELDGVLEETVGNNVLLVLANKQDLPGALSALEITERLHLDKSVVTWHVEGTCAITGEGLNDAVEWFHSRLIQ